MRSQLFVALVAATAATLAGRPALGQPAAGVDPETSSTGYAWLGVSARTLTESDTATLQVYMNSGAWVTQVVPGSPAARAGLREGDVIIGVQSHPIARACEIADVLQRAEPGATVELTFVREGVTADEPVRLSAASGSQAETISRGCEEQPEEDAEAGGGAEMILVP